MTDSNTGNRNTGYSNTGNRNTGYRNTGDRNTGNWNTGNRNTGYSNTGNSNTGNWNTGYRNTGDRNTGNWNTGNWNTGYFCVNDGPVTFFDAPCGLTREEANAAIPYVELSCGAEWVPFDKMSDDDKQANVNAGHMGGFLRKQELPICESFPIAWAKLTADEKQKWLDLPNFDAVKFKAITGVDVTISEPVKHVPDEVIIDGVRYVRQS